jgi:5-methylthioadenosine/S-adenosylhomocysteine deaminase
VNESTKIIENGFVFTGDKQKRAGCLTLLIQNGRITDIGKPVQVLKALHPSAEVINATGKVLLPGFVDAHYAGESFIMRYLTSSQPMSMWNKTPAIKLAYEYLRKGATYEEFLTLYRLSYYAALKSGITTLSEYGIDTPEHSFPAAFEAMRQANIRGFIGLHNGDQMEAARILHEPSVRFACVIEDEENLTTYNLQSTIRFAHEHHWPIVLHLGQTQHACDIVKKNFKKSITQLYAEYRLLDSPVHLIHLACYEESDFDILSKSGVPLVFSPLAILRKGTDMLPFEELLKHRVTLALGSDWGAVQPIENIQAYCSILKTFHLPVEKANDLLALHTKNSARALGLDAEIGSIETGKKADIVFLDLSEFRMSAVLADEQAERMLEVVLQEATSQLVSEVMVNGEFYVREGHLLTYSEDDLAGEGQKILNKLISIDKQVSSKALSSLSPLLSVSSAPVLQLSTPYKNESELLAKDLPFEEGFKIVRKEITRPTPQVKKDVPLDATPKVFKNIKKIFGDDDA